MLYHCQIWFGTFAKHHFLHKIQIENVPQKKSDTFVIGDMKLGNYINQEIFQEGAFFP